jgi:hypothetical protein
VEEAIREPTGAPLGIRSMELDIRGLLTGFALSAAIGVVLYVYLITG